MENKKCFKCGERLPLTEFYTHKGTKDGHLGKCKSCTKKDMADRKKLKSKDPEWAFNERERHRLKSIKRRAEGKVNYGSKKQMDASDPKRRANSAASHIPAPKGSHRHHWSYEEEHWKDVIILPIAEHCKVHRYTIYDKEHLQYRTVHGVLLDSRELAEKYYAIVLTIEDGIYSELQKLF